jgi:hypothetical protein
LKKKKRVTRCVQAAEEEEEEGLHGVHRQLRRNEHPKTKEGCKKFSRKQAVTQRRPTPVQAATPQLLRRRGVTWCAQATTSQRTPENKGGLQEVQLKTGCHPKEAHTKKAFVCET